MKKVLLLFLGIILGLVIMEIFARLTIPLHKEFYLGLNNKYGEEIEREANSLGFRDVKHEFKKPEGVKRILVVGDSITAGWGVRFNQTFARQLEKKFKDVEVIVLARPGWDAMKEIATIEELGMKFAPDLIIIGYCINDPIDPRDLLRFYRRMAYKKPEGINKFFFEHSMLFRFVWKISQDKRVKREFIRCMDRIHTDKYRGWKETVNAYNKLREITKEKNIPVIVVLFPSLDFSFNHYPFLRVHKKVKSLMKAEGFIFVDLLPYLKKYKNTQLFADAIDRHPNRIVHSLVANILYDIIVKKHLLQ